MVLFRSFPISRPLRGGFLLLVVLLVPGTAPGFDGRLPIGKGKLIYRFQQPLPRHSTLHSPLDEKELTRGVNGEWTLYWDPLLDTPRYLSMQSELYLTRSTGIDGEEIARAAGEFIDWNRDFLGVGSEDLLGPVVSRVGRSWLVAYRERAGGIPVRGASLRILVKEDGSLLSIKAFLLPHPGAEFPAFSPFEPIQDQLESWGVRIAFSERQLFFPRYDPGSITSVWYVRGEDANSEPREYFFDPRGGGLWEERRIVFELGEIEGLVMGVYPDPINLYATANQFSMEERNGFLEYLQFPISGVPIGELHGTRIQTTSSNEWGRFRFQIPGDSSSSTILECYLEYGRCGSELPSSPALDCHPAEYRLLLQMLRNPDNCYFFNDEQALEQARLKLVSPPLKIDSSHRFVFNSPSPSEPVSLLLLAFHHLQKFIDNSLERIARNNLSCHDYFPIKVVVPTNVDAIPASNRHRREYFPSESNSKICFSTVLGDYQWLTPTLINHEYAHHVIYILTRALESKHFDCVNPPFDEKLCIENDEDPITVREGQILEGIADALAAFQTDNPTFGYYEPGLPGPLGYDISRIDIRIPPERAEVAKALWDLYQNFSNNSEGETAVDLVYRWLARNAAVESTDRLFDGSQSMMDEILDVLDEIGFTSTSDGNRETISFRDQWVLKSFAGRRFFYAPFIRGDADQDLQLNLTDAIHIIQYLFEGSADRRCMDAMDVEGDGAVDLSDCIYLLGWLYTGGEPPPEPFPDCGLDPAPRDERLSCEEFTCKLQ